MTRVRGFDAHLNKVTLGEVMNIFYLLGMTDHRYEGILSRYAAGATAVVTTDLSQLENLVMGEDERKKIIGLVPTAAPILADTQRAPDAAPKKPPATAPKSPQDKSPPTAYPPEKVIL